MKFRFQDLIIWQKAIEVGNHLLDIADDLEGRKMFRFAEQLRAAGISVSNNIAEGSGSDSNADFRNFLKFARRSVFENANMIIVFNMRGLISDVVMNNILSELNILAAMITNFRKTLNTKQA